MRIDLCEVERRLLLLGAIVLLFPTSEGGLLLLHGWVKFALDDERGATLVPFLPDQNGHFTAHLLDDEFFQVATDRSEDRFSDYTGLIERNCREAQRKIVVFVMEPNRADVFLLLLV